MYLRLYMCIMSLGALNATLERTNSLNTKAALNPKPSEPDPTYRSLTLKPRKTHNAFRSLSILRAELRFFVHRASWECCVGLELPSRGF